MDNLKTDYYYIVKIIEDIDAVQKYMGTLSYEQFNDNELVIDAVLFRLIQMTESIKKLSKELREKHKDVQWNQIIGFRNGIVHDYGNTDYAIVYDIATQDIVTLKETLKTELVIPTLDNLDQVLTESLAQAKSNKGKPNNKVFKK